MMVLVIVVCGFLCASGCQRGAGVKRVPAVKGATKEPQILVEFQAGMTFPETQTSGVRLVVWGDRSVLYWVDPMHPAKDMRVGQLSESQLEAAWKTVHESGLTTHPDAAYVVPDASSVRVVIQVEGKTHTHWASDYRLTNTGWWSKAEEALAKFRPARSQPVAEVATGGMYRGYDVKEWWRTSWRR